MTLEQELDILSGLATLVCSLAGTRSPFSFFVEQPRVSESIPPAANLTLDSEASTPPNAESVSAESVVVSTTEPAALLPTVGPIGTSASNELPQFYLKPRRALPFFAQHPWVFEGAIHHIKGKPQPGDEVELVSDRGEFIARGLYNPDSNIVVRLYSWDEKVRLDEEFWSKRLDDALFLRTNVLKLTDPDGAARLVYSEADGLSGLIVDRYRDWLLVQFTSRALAARKELIVRLLQEKLQPAGLWLRTEKGIREAESLELADGSLSGNTPERPMFIQEHNVRFGVDIVEGQKTGFFLDQRENRQLAARMLQGPRVLDLFCYSGGFSLNVAKAGHAKEIVAVDVSESALTMARANAELNGVGHLIRFEKADAFKYIELLQKNGERFHSIILDPPKMARHRKSVPEAIRGYERLNRLAMLLLEPNGLLMTCSCSGHVDRMMFEEMLAAAAAGAGRRVQILETRGPSADHPTSVHCIENQYLKCYVCRVLP
jgi:23S rRNA (cytosine1962-C5)-methyltransferase